MGNLAKKQKIDDDKVKIELDKDIANQLIKLKNYGDSYSDVIRRLLDKPS